MKDVSRFNPYLMDDALVLSLSTGREKELAHVCEYIDRNASGNGPPQHVLLHGPRGIGKSFFLRLLQIHLADKEGIAFVSLPEEQHNVYQPGDLLREIRHHFVGEDHDSAISAWDSGGQDTWQHERAALEQAREEAGEPHLVVALENFDLLFPRGGAFEAPEDQYMLRQLLSDTPWLTLVATTLYPDLDAQYDDALFHFFAKTELRPWRQEQHEAYLRKRDEQANRETKPLSLAQLKALTRFTGGHPRLTVIMVDVLAEHRIDSAAVTLQKTIDELTPFYQDLLSRIPPKSKLLFDALIRGGEPCSQSDLATRVGTSQSAIAQSFNWLRNSGYLLSEKPPGERRKLYSVRDRLFAHFYLVRYVIHGSGQGILNIMAQFLTDFLARRQSDAQDGIDDLETDGVSKVREHGARYVYNRRGELSIHEEAIEVSESLATLARHAQPAMAYAKGTRYFQRLSALDDYRERRHTLQIIFPDLLAAGTHLTLIDDLLDSALEIFGSDVGLDLAGIRATVTYLRASKDERVLMKMAPEIRSVVEALVEELHL